MAKAKLFRVAVEGATTDGRNIERKWIEQIAKNYTPVMYGARINLEHFKGILPDSPFKSYGDVTAVEAREEKEGPLAGKLALYAQLDPTSDLIALNKKRQKVFTSCEIDPAFAKTGEAYLVGLAVTDTPASLGTEILTFAAQNPEASPFSGRKQSPHNLFTEAVEVELDFEEEKPELDRTGVNLFTRVAELLNLTKKNEAKGDENLSDITKAIEALASHSKQQAEVLSKELSRLPEIEKQLAELKTATDKDRSEFTALKATLANTDDGRPNRPPATGKNGNVALTDC